MNTIEVLIPVRNPEQVFGETIESLISQTDKNFSVLISDNFSTKGLEYVERAVATLQATGIECRSLPLSHELERVEHWNWLHHQSSADWLKPLFAGDSLNSAYMEKLRAAVAAQAAARSVIAGDDWYSRDKPSPAKNMFRAGKFYSPEEARSFILHRGPRFISPGMMAYDRNAFIAVGGYCATLSRLSPALLAMTLAGTYGVLALGEQKEPLCNCSERANVGWCGEFTTTCSLLAYHAWTDNFPFSPFSFACICLRKLALGWFRTPA
jgi:hypothetical protein